MAMLWAPNEEWRAVCGQSLLTSKFVPASRGTRMDPSCDQPEQCSSGSLDQTDHQEDLQGARAHGRTTARAHDRRTTARPRSGILVAVALWGKFVRLVAILLVLGTVADLGLDLYGATRSAQEKSSRPTSPCDDGAARDDCFCCCTHVAVPSHITLAFVLTQSGVGKIVPPATPSIASDPPFHPPKA